MPTAKEPGISRKDFLKILGAGAVVLTVGGFAAFMPSRKNSAGSTNKTNGSPRQEAFGPPRQEAFAQTSGGTWSMG